MKLNAQQGIFYVLAAFLLSGCGIFDSSEKYASPEIPDNMMLYATVFGQGMGLWTLDPNNLAVQDTISTGSSWSINLSPDSKTIYTGWWDKESEIAKVYAIDRETKEIIRSRELWNIHIERDYTGSKLISMGYNYGIQVIDAQSFEILYEGHKQVRNPASRMVASPVKDEFYALVHEENKSGVAGLMVFDTKSFSMKPIIKLTNDEDRRKSMEGAYIDVSPDGKYIYATIFNWQGGGGYGSFHVIDLEKGQQIFESVCAGFAWLGVSPDGRYVYLSDPAGTPFNTTGISYEFIPTNQMLRYDTHEQKIELFADGGGDFGLTGTDLLMTSSIAVAPDSRSMFIRILGSGVTKEGIAPSILHIDTRTKEIINAYELPPDPDGFVRAWMHQIKIGYRPY